MIWNIIINWEYYWWSIDYKRPWLAKAERKERHKKLLEKQIEKREEKKRIIQETNKYIQEKKKAAILTYHSKVRINERIKLKEETIKSNVYKSLLNKRCKLEYSKTLDNYRLFSWIATYILSNQLVLITILPPIKRWEKRSILYKLVTKEQRAYILEKMWFNLDYHATWKNRIANQNIQNNDL